MRHSLINKLSSQARVKWQRLVERNCPPVPAAPQQAGNHSASHSQPSRAGRGGGNAGSSRSSRGGSNGGRGGHNNTGASGNRTNRVTTRPANAGPPAKVKTM